MIVTLAFTCAVLALVRDGTQLRRRVDQLERRLAAVEIESATTIVSEPEKPPPIPRLPSQLLN
jgi:hypothetical protein